MDTRLRQALRDIAALRTIMTEGLDPGPDSAGANLVVRAGRAEDFLGSLYFFAVQVFGNDKKKPWTDEQYAIASAWLHTQKFMKEFCAYYDRWYPPQTFKAHEAAEKFMDLFDALKEKECQTTLSTLSRT